MKRWECALSLPVNFTTAARSNHCRSCVCFFLQKFPSSNSPNGPDPAVGGGGSVSPNRNGDPAGGNDPNKLIIVQAVKSIYHKVLLPLEKRNKSTLDLHLQKVKPIQTRAGIVVSKCKEQLGYLRSARDGLQPVISMLESAELSGSGLHSINAKKLVAMGVAWKRKEAIYEEMQRQNSLSMSNIVRVLDAMDRFLVGETSDEDDVIFEVIQDHTDGGDEEADEDETELEPGLPTNVVSTPFRTLALLSRKK